MYKLNLTNILGCLRYINGTYFDLFGAAGIGTTLSGRASSTELFGIIPAHGLPRDTEIRAPGHLDLKPRTRQSYFRGSPGLSTQVYKSQTELTLGCLKPPGFGDKQALVDPTTAQERKLYESESLGVMQDFYHRPYLLRCIGV